MTFAHESSARSSQFAEQILAYHTACFNLGVTMQWVNLRETNADFRKVSRWRYCLEAQVGPFESMNLEWTCRLVEENERADLFEPLVRRQTSPGGLVRKLLGSSHFILISRPLLSPAGWSLPDCEEGRGMGGCGSRGAGHELKDGDDKQIELLFQVKVNET